MMHEKEWGIQFQIWKSQSWELLSTKLQFEHNVLKWNRKPIWWCMKVNAKYRWVVVLYHGCFLHCKYTCIDCMLCVTQ
jgi:hypothetical protein